MIRYIVLFVLTLPAVSIGADCVAVAPVWVHPYSNIIRVSPQGLLSLDRLDTGYCSWTWVNPSPDGVLFQVSSVRPPSSPVWLVSLCVVDKYENITPKYWLDLNSFWGATFSPDNRWAISLWDEEPDHGLLLLKTEGQTLTTTSQRLLLDGYWVAEIEISRIKNPNGNILVICNDGGMPGLQFLHTFHVTSDGRLIDDQQTISYAPASGNYGMIMSPDGRCLVTLSGNTNGTAVMRIDEQENIDVVQILSAPHLGAFTPDSRFCIFAPNAQSYRVNEDSTLTYVAEAGVDLFLAQSMGVTPDGNFAVIFNFPFAYPYQNTPGVSVVRINHDGTLTYLPGHEVAVENVLNDICFIPPQVLAGYYPWAAGRASWEDSFTSWTSGGGGFDSPKFDRTSTGTLVISPTSANCFGYWQSPVDACMVVPYSLYRASYVLNVERSTFNAERVPGLRLRANAQTFQQADTLSINSLGDAHLSPTLTPTTYTLFLEPPISSISREETLDDLFLSLDLMAFDPADDVGTSIVLSYCVVDRYPVDAMTSWTLVREYSFDTSTEGWATGGAPGVYTEPQYTAWPGALILKATNNTNCFGYWHSNPDDIVTSTCGELYRATFEVHTDITDRTKVPEIRLRINTEDGQLGVSHSIQSTIDSEMSPYFDPARPSRTFIYNVYLWKPPATYQDKLILSCDLLNFSPDDSASGSIMLDSVRLTTHPVPQFPMDREE